MSQPRLPDGFAVQLDRRVRVLGSGAALLGGSPRRLLRLSRTAQGLIEDGRIHVHDPVSAQLARTLLDATVAHPRPAGGPSYRDVTVVIPVRDNPTGLSRLVPALRGMRVVIVDDGSAIGVDAAQFAGLPSEVTVLRHGSSRGPGAARNTGMAHCETEFVAFLDSDVVPRRGWLEALLGHFCDPVVALVAPRIVALDDGESLVGRYEAICSSLDLGAREAPVVPYGAVAYVPSAAIVCRRSAVLAVGGFDESLRVGEDVDLCWRLIEAGSRLRYEPVAMVAHEHRIRLGDWLARKAVYGSSAAPLALRHPDKTSALVIPLWSLVAWMMLALGGWWIGAVVATVYAGMTARRISRSVRHPGLQPNRVEIAGLALSGLSAGAVRLSSAACRDYWPASVAAAAVSRRCRRALLVAALVDAVHGWCNRRPAAGGASGARPIGPLGYSILRRLDDLAYGAGVWTGVVRERTLQPLKPDIKR